MKNGLTASSLGRWWFLNYNQKEETGLKIISSEWLESVFAIICHMAAVLWVQAEMCDGSVRFNSTVFHLRSPLAQFHYPRGIQGVMASRARNPGCHFKFFAQAFLVIVQELRGSVWKDLYSDLYLLTSLRSFLSCTSILIFGWCDLCAPPFDDLKTHLDHLI